MKIKNSRTVAVELHPSIHHVLNVVDRVWRHETDSQPRVTGLGEEGHSEGSRHYGLEGDIRIRAVDIDADDNRLCPAADVSLDLRPHLARATRERIDTELRARLGTEFDIVWEGIGTISAHCHIEYDPKPLG